MSEFTMGKDALISELQGQVATARAAYLRSEEINRRLSAERDKLATSCADWRAAWETAIDRPTPPADARVLKAAVAFADAAEFFSSCQLPDYDAGAWAWQAAAHELRAIVKDWRAGNSTVVPGEGKDNRGVVEREALRKALRDIRGLLVVRPHRFADQTEKIHAVIDRALLHAESRDRAASVAEAPTEKAEEVDGEALRLAEEHVALLSDAGAAKDAEIARLRRDEDAFRVAVEHVFGPAALRSLDEAVVAAMRARSAETEPASGDAA